MDIEYLIQLLENRLTILNNARVQSISAGDLDGLNKIDQEIFNVQNTIVQLRLTLQISNAATTANVPVADVVTSGVQVAQNSSTIPDNPTQPLTEYDISTYATDPLYIQKITDILQSMGSMDTSTQIDSYISSEAVGSPLDGQMILSLAQQYSVDTRLLVAILELESNFGTAGVAVYTLNPGNVGNTGTTTQTYSSWANGVSAVAQWLSNHKIITASTTDNGNTNTNNVSANASANTTDATTTTSDATVVLPSTSSDASTTPSVLDNATTTSTTTSDSILNASTTTPVSDIAPENSTTTSDTEATSTQAYGGVKKITVTHVV